MEHNVDVNLEQKCGLAVAILLTSHFLVAQSPEKPLDTTICKLTANPSAYIGTFVRIRAVYIGPFEGEGLHDPNCKQGQWNGKSAIRLVASEDKSKVIKDREYDKFQRFAYATTGCCAAPEYKVTATFIGQIVGRNVRRHKESNWHFVLRSVSDVVAEEPDEAITPTRSPLPDRLPDKN